jgi:hypothetical protein
MSVLAWTRGLLLAVAIALFALGAGCGDDGCESHEDCGAGQVCRFGQGGACLTTCAIDDDCPADLVCDSCATSSCPVCEDCIRACAPPR